MPFEAAQHPPKGDNDVCVANILKVCYIGQSLSTWMYLVSCLCCAVQGPLLELAPTLAAQTKPGGVLGLSGILSEQVADVQAAYEPYFTAFEQHLKDKWALLTAVRRSEQ